MGAGVLHKHRLAQQSLCRGMRMLHPVLHGVPLKGHQVLGQKHILGFHLQGIQVQSTVISFLAGA